MKENSFFNRLLFLLNSLLATLLLLSFLLPYISPKIEKFSSGDITDSIVLITALDSTKPLLKKILNYQPRRIYTLTNIF